MSPHRFRGVPLLRRRSRREARRLNDALQECMNNSNWRERRARPDAGEGRALPGYLRFRENGGDQVMLARDARGSAPVRGRLVSPNLHLKLTVTGSPLNSGRIPLERERRHAATPAAEPAPTHG